MLKDLFNRYFGGNQSVLELQEPDNTAFTDRIAELEVRLVKTDAWSANARSVLVGLAMRQAKKIHEIGDNLAQKRRWISELQARMKSPPTSRNDRDLGVIVSQLSASEDEVKQITSQLIGSGCELVHFVLRHELDKSIVFGIPAAHLRNCVEEWMAGGHLLNGRLGKYEVSWATELMTHALVTSPPAASPVVVAPSAESVVAEA